MSLLWREAVGYAIPENPCLCEHADHESPSESMHPDLGAPAGHHRASFVGPICDDCAHGHLAEYVHDAPCPDCPR